MVMALWRPTKKRENPFCKIIFLIFLPFSPSIHHSMPLIEGEIAKSFLDAEAKLPKIDIEDVKIDTFMFLSSQAIKEEKVVTHARTFEAERINEKCDDLVL